MTVWLYIAMENPNLENAKENTHRFLSQETSFLWKRFYGYKWQPC